MEPTTIVLLLALAAVTPRTISILFLIASHAYFALWAWQRKRTPAVRGLALWAYWWREASAMLTLARFRLRRRSAGFHRVSDGSRPVLLLHGYTQDASNFHRLRDEIESRLGRPTVAINMGRPFRTLDDYTPALLRAMQRLTRDAGANGFDVVAHSMGGLILRIALQDNADVGRAIRRIVTVGSPHRGTASARGPVVGQDARGMREGSLRLANLQPLPALAPQARCVFIAAAQDYVVYPTETSFEPDATCITLSRPGHAGLLVEPTATAAIVEALAGDDV